MSFGIQIDNVEGKTLITDKITNHFIHSTGSIYNNNAGNVPRYAFPPPNALDSDLILIHPIRDASITNNTRVWVCVDNYNSSQNELSYNYAGGLADRFDYAIVRDFFNTQVNPSGYGLSVFADNGNCTYWSGFKNSNVEIVATAEFLSSDVLEETYLGSMEEDYDAGTITEDEFLALVQTNVFGSRIIFQFDSLDDIYVAASSTYAHAYADSSDATVGYIFDFDNNTIECVRGTVRAAITSSNLPFDIRQADDDYTEVNYLSATYGIYKIRGLD